MCQYWVDNFMDGIAVHYLMLAQFNVHPRAENTYSGTNVRTLKDIFQQRSILPPYIFDSFRTNTFRNCISITRYGLIGELNLMKFHLDLRRH